MLLFLLLEAGLLDAARGDVVVFNNTSAEHPETYRFSRQCKERVEQDYGIPFFWVEFQTYEDARRGRWTRLPSYRLVRPEPRSDANPDGYQGRGEAFEELLSWSGYLPSLFQRTCTKHLKLEATRAFLQDWFRNQERTSRLGHFGRRSRIADDDLYAAHKRSGGNVPRDILLRKKEFLRSRPIFRPAQKFRDYSACAKPFGNAHVAAKMRDEGASFGKGGVEYLAFVGLRRDEQRRVVKVRRRNAGGPASRGYEGEHVYMPLHALGLTEADVDSFWARRDWGLKLRPEDSLSNCTYCFLKGARWLQAANRALRKEAEPGHANTPCDINWWIALEEKYGRDLDAENRSVRTAVPSNFIGFFGPKRTFTYRTLRDAAGGLTVLPPDAVSMQPCDCTD